MNESPFLDTWFVLADIACAAGRRASGGCRLDEADRALVRDGRRVPLTPLEYGVMRYLVHHPARVVSRDELVRAVWDQTVTGSNVVDAVIRRLRKKLGEWARSIETVVGHGYRFQAWRAGIS